MKNQFKIVKIVVWVVVFLMGSNARAQVGNGSVYLQNGFYTSEPTDSTFIFAETLYLGPNAQLEINGIVIVYSSTVWIAPTAKLLGTGKIVFENPANNPFYSGIAQSPTFIDANNGQFINLNIEHRNPNNLELTDLADPGYGTANPTGSLSAGLQLGKELSFEVDMGDIILNGFDLSLSPTGTLSNYGVNRMIVTNNNINGHVVKQNTSVSSFTFPVGISEGDYTPATIEGTNTYHVGVVDYSLANPVIQNLENGMNRVWHVFGGAANKIILQHNSPTTDGSNYVDTLAYISRYEGTGLWTTGNSEFTATGLHENQASIALDIPIQSTTDSTWLTKFSKNLKPEIVQCIQDQNLYATANGCQYIVPDYTVDSTLVINGNCPSSQPNCITITQLPIAGSALSNDTIVWIFIENQIGEMDSCSFQIHFLDTIAPIIETCIADTLISPNAGCMFSVPDLTSNHQLIVSDNCSNTVSNQMTITQNPVAFTPISENTPIWIFVTDASGNKDSCQFTVKVEACGILVPEIFSPNGDGANETFFITNLDQFSHSRVWIYNRWGTEVYQNDDYQNQWDGTSQSNLNVGGDKLPEGTYYYVLQLGQKNGNTSSGEILKGFVYIKR